MPDDEAVALRKMLISQMRIAMAHASIDLLRPDLVILDEFQRFKDLFADDSTITLTDAQKLAQQVISTRRCEDSGAVGYAVQDVHAVRRRRR